VTSGTVLTGIVSSASPPTSAAQGGTGDGGATGAPPARAWSCGCAATASRALGDLEALFDPARTHTTGVLAPVADRSGPTTDPCSSPPSVPAACSGAGDGAFEGDARPCQDVPARAPRSSAVPHARAFGTKRPAVLMRKKGMPAQAGDAPKTATGHTSHDRQHMTVHDRGIARGTWRSSATTSPARHGCGAGGHQTMGMAQPGRTTLSPKTVKRVPKWSHQGPGNCVPATSSRPGQQGQKQVSTRRAQRRSGLAAAS